MGDNLLGAFLHLFVKKTSGFCKKCRPKLLAILQRNRCSLPFPFKNLLLNLKILIKYNDIPQLLKLKIK